MKNLEQYWVIIVPIFILSLIIQPAICFLIFGLLISFISIKGILLMQRINKSGIQCVGEIVHYDTDNDGDKIPVVEFKTIEGQIITKKPTFFVSTDLGNLRTFNKRILIVYDSLDPEQFIIDGEEGGNYIFVVLFLLAGLFFCIISICGITGYIEFNHSS